jgi:hypothetical protein
MLQHHSPLIGSRSALSTLSSVSTRSIKGHYVKPGALVWTVFQSPVMASYSDHELRTTDKAQANPESLNNT